ncbi:MAG: helix-turn-helix domain-containing protein [Bryobacteraceae bacterium]
MSEIGTWGALGDREASPRDPRIKRAIAVIDENLADPMLSLLRLGEALNISQRSLGRLFKKETGVHFRRHLLNARIERAKDLLLTSADEIKMIAAAVGYSSHTHFGQDFRECTGMSPRDFRKAARRR